MFTICVFVCVCIGVFGVFGFGLAIHIWRRKTNTDTNSALAYFVCLFLIFLARLIWLFRAISESVTFDSDFVELS